MVRYEPLWAIGPARSGTREEPDGVVRRTTYFPSFESVRFHNPFQLSINCLRQFSYRPDNNFSWMT